MRRVRLAHVAPKTTANRQFFPRSRILPSTTSTQQKSDFAINDADETHTYQPGEFWLFGNDELRPGYQSGDFWRGSGKRKTWYEGHVEHADKDKEMPDTSAVTPGERSQEDPIKTETWRKDFSLYTHKFHRRVVQAKQYVRAAEKYPECGIGIVSLSPAKGEQSLPPFDTFWNVNFAAISGRYNLAYPKRLRVGNLFVNGEIASRAYQKFELQKIHNPCGNELQHIRHVWSSTHLFWVADQKLHWWPTIMLWFLHNNPEFAAKFLLASYVEPYPPFYMVADSLEYLASYYLQSTEMHTVVEADYFRAMFYILLNSCDATRPSISQKTIFLLATHSTAEQALYLQEVLHKAGIRLHHETLLHFAYVHANAGEFQKALDTLEAAVVAGADPLSESFLATCNKTLHCSVLHPDGYHASSYIISRFLELGAEMNLKLYNVLIVNALAANDLLTALRIFSLLEENKVEIGHVTYLILLNGYKHSTEAVGEFEATVVRKAHECTLRTQDPWLATEILHCTYLHYLKSSDGKDHDHIAIFDSTLAAYTRYFQIWPLRILNIDARQGRERKVYLPPPPAAINIILTAYLKAYPARAPSTFKLFLAYFENAVESGGQTTRYFRRMSKLLTNDYTYNVFLMALSQDERNLQSCTSLVQQMGKVLPAHLLPPDYCTREPLELAQPTAQTWSILLNAFAQHGQVAAAEKVMDLMRKRGLEINVVTWNSLLKGYVLLQDIPGVVEALGRMEGEGFDADKFTTSTLKKITDRQGFIEAWKSMRDQGEKGLFEMDGGKEEELEGEDEQSFVQSVDPLHGSEEDTRTEGTESSHHEGQTEVPQQG
ncbi:pentatricopeptide repeat protein [Venturia nashicola]|uniref:Pentatricopeptide repeat protein n=1 Tax=Venturia nashicola TaxID=86259 RepID=A0A4Z1P5Y4_9PEZI|nr:pentatricopeptide repeat protein [Venturia nashicola]TLD22687.1 pentatricopeptide repeat protein [Venturia nashicola]